MAGLIETVDMWGRIGAIASGAKPGKLPKPPRIRHPERPSAKPKGFSVMRSPEKLAQFRRQQQQGGD